MTYRQGNKVDRECEICHKSIEIGCWMLDLFREENAEGGERVRWVHESCARRAIEAWLRKKWEKNKEIP